MLFAISLFIFAKFDITDRLKGLQEQMDKNEKLEQERLSNNQRHRDRIVDEVLCESGNPLTIQENRQCPRVARKVSKRKEAFAVNVKT